MRYFGILFWTAILIFFAYLVLIEYQDFGLERPRSWIGLLLVIVIGGGYLYRTIGGVYASSKSDRSKNHEDRK